MYEFPIANICTGCAAEAFDVTVVGASRVGAVSAIRATAETTTRTAVDLRHSDIRVTILPSGKTDNRPSGPHRVLEQTTADVRTGDDVSVAASRELLGEDRRLGDGQPAHGAAADVGCVHSVDRPAALQQG